MPDVAVHSCNPSTWQVEAGRLREGRGGEKWSGGLAAPAESLSVVPSAHGTAYNNLSLQFQVIGHPLLALLGTAHTHGTEIYVQVKRPYILHFKRKRVKVILGYTVSSKPGRDTCERLPPLEKNLESSLDQVLFNSALFMD